MRVLHIGPISATNGEGFVNKRANLILKKKHTLYTIDTYQGHKYTKFFLIFFKIFIFNIQYKPTRIILSPSRRKLIFLAYIFLISTCKEKNSKLFLFLHGSELIDVFSDEKTKWLKKKIDKKIDRWLIGDIRLKNFCLTTDRNKITEIPNPVDFIKLTPKKLNTSFYLFLSRALINN